jgi:hypothetical protein
MLFKPYSCKNRASAKTKSGIIIAMSSRARLFPAKGSRGRNLDFAVLGQIFAELAGLSTAE